MILEANEKNFRPFHHAFRVLYNSYYNGVGEKYPRPQRGLLTRPSRAEVTAYRQNVDARMQRPLGRELPPDLVALVELGLRHEQQHQELIVTDVLHMLSMNPLLPAYQPNANVPLLNGPLAWHDFAGGVVPVGHDGGGFCFNNELPRHWPFLEPYQLASRLVTNAEYLAFVANGEYNEPSLWLSEDWEFVRTKQLLQPLYWHCQDGHWRVFSLNGLADLQADAPVLNVSDFEASAYAQWANARLPTEAEWEHAVLNNPGLDRMFGLAWQWTSSAYAPYPGFNAAAGAIAEYNGKSMANQYVLRGASLATPSGHSRPTYRNFFPATARWQFSGIRLTR